jgi:AcrR family transcriptional regulator
MAEPAATDAHTRLREVALDLFGRQGVRETSTRQILAAAGMRNPSAISYHFGSKAELVDDLVGELIRGEAPVMQRQVALADGPEPPSIEEWTSIAVDSASALISTERGCLLARLWWQYDGYLHPEVVEELLASGHPVANRWLDAVDATFPDLNRWVAVTRNVTMLRTLEWMIARRAGRILTGKPSPALQMDDPDAFRQLMLEVALGIVTAPSTLTEADIVFRE